MNYSDPLIGEDLQTELFLRSSPIRWVGEDSGHRIDNVSLSIHRFENLFCTVAHLGPDRLRSQLDCGSPRTQAVHKTSVF